MPAFAGLPGRVADRIDYVTAFAPSTPIVEFNSNLLGSLWVKTS
jgi:hypothetical protein